MNKKKQKITNLVFLFLEGFWVCNIIENYEYKKISMFNICCDFFRSEYVRTNRCRKNESVVERSAVVCC